MDAIKLFMAIPDRINFLQMGRYGCFSEQTYRNNFENDDFDWFTFNETIIREHLKGSRKAIAVDPSFIHFNASLAAINLAKAACKRMGIKYSISSCKSVIHNAYMLERFICVSGIEPNTQLIDKLFKELILFTARAA